MLGLMKNPVMFGVVTRFCDGAEDRGRFFTARLLEAWDRQRALGFVFCDLKLDHYLRQTEGDPEQFLANMTFTLRF